MEFRFFLSLASKFLLSNSSTDSVCSCKMKVISKQSDLVMSMLLFYFCILTLLLAAGFEERFQKESLLCSSAVRPTLVKVICSSFSYLLSCECQNFSVKIS
jgi:hypothetical protein